MGEDLKQVGGGGIDANWQNEIAVKRCKKTIWNERVVSFEGQCDN